jgi:hypothetical protein
MRQVLFAILPEVVLLDVAGAAEAFRMAGQFAPGSYELQFVGPNPSVRSAVGLHLSQLQPLPASVHDGAIVVIAGVSSRALDLNSPAAKKLGEWLAKVSRNACVPAACLPRRQDCCADANARLITSSWKHWESSSLPRRCMAIVFSSRTVLCSPAPVSRQASIWRCM